MIQRRPLSGLSGRIPSAPSNILWGHGVGAKRGTPEAWRGRKAASAPGETMSVFWSTSWSGGANRQQRPLRGTEGFIYICEVGDIMFCSGSLQQARRNECLVLVGQGMTGGVIFRQAQGECWVRNCRKSNTEPRGRWKCTKGSLRTMRNVSRGRIHWQQGGPKGHPWGRILVFCPWGGAQAPHLSMS